MSTNGKSQTISHDEQKDPDYTRGAGVGVQHRGLQDVIQAPQSNQKGAASAPSRLDTDVPFQITLALDPHGGKPSIAPQIVVVDGSEESKSDISVSMDTPIDFWVNDVNSTVVKDQSPEQVYQRMASVLKAYSSEMDMTPNEAQQCIDCVLFTNSSFEALRFKVGVFEMNGVTRFELLRSDGGALSMAKFEGELKALFFGKDTQNGNEEKEDEADDANPFSFCTADPLDVSGMDLSGLALPNMPSPGKMSQGELNAIREAVMRNDKDCVEDLYDLHTELVKDTSMVQDVTDHDELMNTLMDTATKHEDIAVVRGCLVILDTLCNDEDAAMQLMQENAIYKRLSEMLKTSTSLLIRNYVVRLLATLSTLKWNMDSDLAKEVNNAVKQYHGVWKKSLSVDCGLIEEKTFTAIYNKLSQFN